MTQARRPAGTPTGGQFAPINRPAATGVELTDDDLMEASEPSVAVQPPTSSTKERLAALMPLCRYGSDYNRSVASAVSDYHHFADLGEVVTAEHYLLSAEQRAGYIEWEELVERDPFERIAKERQAAAAAQVAGTLGLTVEDVPVTSLAPGDLLWHDGSFNKVVDTPADTMSAGRLATRVTVRRYGWIQPEQQQHRQLDFFAGSTVIGWRYRGDEEGTVPDYSPAASINPVTETASAPKVSGKETVARLFPNGEPNRGVRRHKLLTAELVEQMPGLYDSEGTPVADKLIYAHYFTASADWHIAELDRETGEMFGRCDLGLGFPEWGYVTIEQLATMTANFGLPVERDLDFKPRTARELGLEPPR
ncbi:MAG: DUF2958 domain-containing protein [Acidimicrobiales bacterium]